MPIKKISVAVTPPKKVAKKATLITPVKPPLPGEYRSSTRHRVYSTAYKHTKKLLKEAGAVNTKICQQAAHEAVKKFLESSR